MFTRQQGELGGRSSLLRAQLVNQAMTTQPKTWEQRVSFFSEDKSALVLCISRWITECLLCEPGNAMLRWPLGHHSRFFTTSVVMYKKYHPDRPWKTTWDQEKKEQTTNLYFSNDTRALLKQ
jgi:hypothetical protein